MKKKTLPYEFVDKFLIEDNAFPAVSGCCEPHQRIYSAAGTRIAWLEIPRLSTLAAIDPCGITSRGMPIVTILM